VTPPHSKEHLYVLPLTMERTPTHKIKFIVERDRLLLARRIYTEE
jgi:hypothetical protein